MGSSRFPFYLAAALAAPYCLYSWSWLLVVGLGYHGHITPLFGSVGWDWAIFHAVSKAWYAGELGRIYDPGWIHSAVAAVSPGALKANPFPAFEYPPTFVLLLLPFGALDFAASYALSQLALFSALAVAISQSVRRSSRRLFYVAAVVVCPAASAAVGSGQDSALILAFLVAGFGMLERYPFAAGLVIGLASFKPQLMLMVPVALIVSGNGRALLGAAISAIAFASLSVLAFGTALWVQWFDLMLHTAGAQDWGRMWDQSIFTIAMSLGAAPWLANAAQMAVVLAGAATVALSFRSTMQREMKLAVLLATSALCAPHVSPYDMILVAYAAAIMAWAQIEDGAWIPLLASIAAWLLPILGQPRRTPTGVLIPVVIAALIFALIARKRDQSEGTLMAW